VISAEGLLETIFLLIELSVQSLADFCGSGVLDQNDAFPIQIIQTLPILTLLLELLLALCVGVAKEVVEECTLSCIPQ